jgi:tRNA pseudouridine38-40 synthase
VRRVALKIAYLGTDYYGFQRQPDLTTVEGEILSALEETGVVADVNRCGFGVAGRTDRGVHSLGNVITFLTEEEVRINQINGALPKNIRVLGQAKVPLRFKVRYALNRHYRYLLPLVPADVYPDLNKMIEAAELFRGTHDFTNFSKKSDRNPVRTIDDIKVKKGADLIQVDVVGESFLWNMVRKIVSVLLTVGRGELPVEIINEFFNPEKDFCIVPMPPEGLILMDITYFDIKFHEDTYAVKTFKSFLKQEYLKNQAIALSQKEMMENLKG